MLMHLAIALVTYNALSGWLPLDHQHDGLDAQRLELRAPGVYAGLGPFRPGSIPRLGVGAQERFHAGDHEERDQNSAAYERCELGSAGSHGIAANGPPQGIAESKHDDGGGAGSDTRVERTLRRMPYDGRAAPYQAKVRTSRDQEFDNIAQNPRPIANSVADTK